MTAISLASLTFNERIARVRQEKRRVSQEVLGSVISQINPKLGLPHREDFTVSFEPDDTCVMSCNNLPGNRSLCYMISQDHATVMLFVAENEKEKLLKRVFQYEISSVKLTVGKYCYELVDSTITLAQNAVLQKIGILCGIGDYEKT